MASFTSLSATLGLLANGVRTLKGCDNDYRLYNAFSVDVFFVFDYPGWRSATAPPALTLGYVV